MESTGVFWKPIWNLLEDRFTILLVKARHVKQVPGRKRDVGDAEWIAQLLQHGLLRASFIPPLPIRELRDLTRHRTTLLQERTRVVNRIHKVLEDANSKLSAVASDIMGVSGRAMLRALTAGETDPRRWARTISIVCRHANSPAPSSGDSSGSGTTSICSPWTRQRNEIFGTDDADFRGWPRGEIWVWLATAGRRPAWMVNEPARQMSRSVSEVDSFSRRLVHHCGALRRSRARPRSA